MGWRGRRVSARRWQTVWSSAVRVTAAGGLVCAVATWGMSGPLATCVALMVPTSAACVMAGAGGVRAVMSTALRVSLALVGAAGLVAAAGWSGVAWLVFLAATTPFVRTIVQAGRLLRGGPSQRADWAATVLAGGGDAAEADRWLLPSGGPGQLPTLAPLTELPDVEGVSALDDQEVCAAWRRSYVQLEFAGAERRLEVVRLRQVYLDELSRRHPVEVRRWLASGARAAGNPLPFLERPAVRPEAPSDDEWWPEVG